MRFTPEQEQRVDAVNQAMRTEFFAQLAAHSEGSSGSSAPLARVSARTPRVLFVRTDVDSVLGDDHDELAAKFRKAARVAASCGAAASWDATAVYGSRPGQPACWRIVLG